MNDQLKSILSIAVTFFVTLALNTALNFYSSEKGAVSISKPIAIDGKLFSIVTIENYSSEIINNAAFEISSQTPTVNIFADTPVGIKEEISAPKNKTKTIVLNGINPRIVTRILFPSSSETDGIRLVNGEAIGVILHKDDQLESPLSKAIKSALTTALIYAILYSTFIYYSSRHANEVKEEIKSIKTELKEKQLEISESSKERKNELDKVSLRIKEMESLIAKQRLLLLARINDYSKELDFWKNCFKEAITKSANDGLADSLIKSVTTKLNSHGTTPRADTYAAIEVAANWLNSAKSENSSK